MRLVTTGATPKRLSNRGRPGRPDGPQDRAGSFDPKPVQNGNALTRAGVMGFAERACGGRGTHSAQNVLGALRSFLRFAHVTGVIGQELASAVPTAGSVRAGLPRRLDRAEVARLLGSCDRGSRMGRRDFAVLTVLWRLGLRSAETAGLTLEDIDWPVGEVVVRGKGGRCDRLPLPVDVGKALVGYLRRGRPRSTSRVLFLRQRAPHVGMTRQGVANIVNAACRRAGIARVGPHALRHTAATEMLRGGATLTEVAQVLRHRRLLSTTTYAHADMSHKQRAIDRTKPLTTRPGRYQPDDALLAFLENL